MISLIQTYNDELCKDRTNPFAQTSYTRLLEQYKILATQVDCLKEQMHQAEEEIKSYQEQVQILQEKNTYYQLFQQQIFQAVETQKQKVIVE